MRRGCAGKRRDVNERAIVEALRQIGVQVYHISGPGLPDLLTCHRGNWLPIEVKGPRGQLTPAQLRTQAHDWFPVVTTVKEALELITDRGAEIVRLKDWRDDVTCALRRTGGSAYDNVPNHIRRLLANFDALANAVVGIDYRSPEDHDAWPIEELVKQAQRARMVPAGTDNDDIPF